MFVIHDNDDENLHSLQLMTNCMFFNNHFLFVHIVHKLDPFLQSKASLLFLGFGKQRKVHI